ncbi:adenylyl-sulfate kinase [Actinophytocola sediminis]
MLLAAFPLLIIVLRGDLLDGGGSARVRELARGVILKGGQVLTPCSSLAQQMLKVAYLRVVHVGKIHFMMPSVRQVKEVALGGTVWLTGLPSSGKSTLAAGLAERLSKSRSVEVLDGDVIRRNLFPELGFSKDDRTENVRRTGVIARMLASHGAFVITPVIAPYRAAREAVRKEHGDHGLLYVEIFVDAAPEICAERDVKGLYARAKRGEITGLTGFDDPYESPIQPELHLRTDQLSVSECLHRMIQLVETIASRRADGHDHA